MDHRISHRLIAAMFSLGLAGGAVAPMIATADGKTMEHAHHHARTATRKRHHSKRGHRRHARAKPVATTPTGQSATADFASGPFHVQFTAQRAAGAPATAATGTFHAEATAGSSPFMTLAGPVTCLDVVGHQMGLFYPVSSVTPTAEGALIKGVYIYASTTAAGKPQGFNFAPSTSATTSGCAPIPDLLPITSGTLSLTS